MGGNKREKGARNRRKTRVFFLCPCGAEGIKSCLSFGIGRTAVPSDSRVLLPGTDQRSVPGRNRCFLRFLRNRRKTRFFHEESKIFDLAFRCFLRFLRNRRKTRFFHRAIYALVPPKIACDFRGGPARQKNLSHIWLGKKILPMKWVGKKNLRHAPANPFMRFARRAVNLRGPGIGRNGRPLRFRWKKKSIFSSFAFFPIFPPTPFGVGENLSFFLKKKDRSFFSRNRTEGQKISE